MGTAKERSERTYPYAGDHLVTLDGMERVEVWC